MSAKKYVAWLAGFLLVFMAGNLVLWYFAVKESFIQGDLNRMGNFNSTNPLTPEASYSRHPMELEDYLALGSKESFDVVTLGDSFSNGCGRGLYYQDCLAEKYGLKSINASFVGNCLEDLYILIELGILDELHPSAVILESVGRAVQNRIGVHEILPSEMTHEYAERILKRKISKTSERLASGFFAPVMSKAVIKFLFNIVYHAIDNERLSNAVYIAGLNRELFTNPGYENTLLYYYEDLLFLNNSPHAEMINKNLSNANSINSNETYSFPSFFDKSTAFINTAFNSRLRYGSPPCTLGNDSIILRDASFSIRVFTSILPSKKFSTFSPTSKRLISK